MVGEDSGSGSIQWPIWLLAGIISVPTTVTEIFLPTLAPLVAPHLCTAVVGFKLPQRQFLLLVAILIGAIYLPLVAHSGDSGLVHRFIGTLCLLAIASSRWRSPVSDWFRKDVGSDSTNLPSNSLSSAPTTKLHDTEHRSDKDKEVASSLEDGLAGDLVGPALERLKSGGKFDKDQLRIIETEMRVLEGHTIAINYASSLEKGLQVGRFVIDESLGRGGEGNVYRAHDEIGRMAAIKILHNHRVSDRFRREMHLVRQLAHPNIVTAYEVGEFRGLPFITMELLRGPDLYAMVQDAGPLDWLEATLYVLQTARALAHAHQRDLIHRDIKPGNLILNGDETVKVVDFGLAAICGNDTLMDSVFRFETQEGHLAGTLPYMAPEQARSLANATVRSDIYALGATWFYMLTGQERLRGNSFAKQFENLLVRRRFSKLPRDCMPESLRSIYRRMVAYDVNDRIQRCDALVAELEKCLNAEGQLVDVEGIHVLVVEDSRTDMLFTIEMLRRSNSTLTIHQARSLDEGLTACRHFSINLAILDLKLPDSSGVETVVRFREAYSDMPLVVLTGMAQDEVGVDCLAAGADTFISKNGLTAHRMERTIFVTLSRCRLPRRTTI